MFSAVNYALLVFLFLHLSNNHLASSSSDLRDYTTLKALYNYVREKRDDTNPTDTHRMACWKYICDELDMEKLGCECKFSKKDDFHRKVNCNSFHFSKALKILKTTVKGKESAYCSEEAFPSSHTADTIPGNLTDLSNITNKDGGIADIKTTDKKINYKTKQEMKHSLADYVDDKPKYKYQEYPRDQPNRTEYREMFTAAYRQQMDDRVSSALRAGTAIGRFSSSKFQKIWRFFRPKRSVDHFRYNRLRSSPGVYYYTLSNLPNSFYNEDGVIAATLSDWAAKAPICFRERVSSWEPPPNFSITFIPGLTTGSRNLISQTVSVSGRRQIQLNTNYVYKPGNARSYVKLENSLPAVILHEVGHLLGVPHSHDKSSSSAMYKNVDYKNGANYLNTFERTTIQHLYGRCYGPTDAITNILYNVGPHTYSTTFISRKTAVWEYSYNLDRVLEGSIDAMVQIYEGAPGSTPRFYVFKGYDGYIYTYNHGRSPRIKLLTKISIASLTRNKMRKVDAALWAEITSTLYLFSGSQVCLFGSKWNFLRCSSINFLFQGLGNHRIDEAYQYVHQNRIEYAFFQGKNVYEGAYNGRFWSISYRGMVPHQTGYKWNDLCENLC
ncbi:MMP21 [Bugula neritina]|uniref:MMP21 n=1 Tax=Bugula neritina TaxID=10212 RepID=A0A7J7JDH4_BUGNE|nr:MMP21 [Bugula neritina]